MPQEIRTLIYKLDLFCPRSNGGYSIDSFYHYSDELTDYSIEKLEVELAAMVSEELLKLQDGKYFWATTEGKVTRQKYFAQKGILSKPLAEQRAHSLEDLILALVASNRVNVFSGSDLIPLESLPIYLYEFSNEEINTAKNALVSYGFIRDDEFFPRKGIYITGRGLHKYKNDSRIKLNLGSAEGILRLLTPVERDARFSSLGFDLDLQENLERRWLEMEACAFGEAYLAAVIMLGGILEGALLAKLRANIQAAMTSSKAPRDKSGAVKQLDDWTLAEYISVATDLGFVPRSVEKHSHELRDTRNLVHPRKQVNEQIVVDESLYRISKEVAETVIDALST
ncbi:hypothetical protein ACLIKD_00760 [Azonexus sp. IMCC34842]|uniref:hypothetical protein n=1 Tax=Azonexus sp. IMCC34842 TaxID=3420950 RepID=UPI003D132356